MILILLLILVWNEAGTQEQDRDQSRHYQSRHRSALRISAP